MSNMLFTAPDVARAARKLLDSGAIKCTTFLLKAAALASNEAHHAVKDGEISEQGKVIARQRKDTIALLLCLVRVMISSVETSPLPASDAAPGENPFVRAFVSDRGPQALELLRSADCVMFGDGSGEALHELTQLRALLGRMRVLDAAAAAADTAEQVAARAQAVADVRIFAQSYSGGWLEAFNEHIACCLEESGYPRRVSRHHKSNLFCRLAAPVRASAAPSAAALALLQSRARESVPLLAWQHRLWSGYDTADAVMRGVLVDAESQEQFDFRMVIRLDDERFPSHSTHSRAATWAGLGCVAHWCFLPPGQNAETAPFLTFYHWSACASAPLMLPDTDIVYGEYSALLADDVTHPVGTVLMYPRALASPKTNGSNAHDIPWFLVFKPCMASLLRGAVPVGRVMSFVEGTTAEKDDNSAQPFSD